MTSDSDYSLENLLNLNDFANIQTDLAEIVHFSLVTTDMEGKPISSISNFSSFCQLIRSSEKGYQSCVDCDKKALNRSLRQQKSIVYDCHCGLKDCAAPIILDHVPIGGVLGGQVLIDEAQRKNIDTAALAEKFSLDKHALDKALAEVPIVTEDYIRLCLRFYSFFAEYIAEKGSQTITQQKLAQETMERIRLQQIATDQLLKRLQAQMNPHFLFNALNSIARTALIEGAEETEQLIYDLSNYLRYTIKNRSDTPTIAEELDNLHHYLNIQRLRFGDRISCQIYVEDHLKDYRIPSMTLQPLVENCIIHGLKDCTHDGQIKVSIATAFRTPKTDICIEIWDNGVGIPQKVLDEFEAEKEMVTDTLGLGLVNTQLRIWKMYGKPYGITLDSRPGEYARVSILLPSQR